MLNQVHLKRNGLDNQRLISVLLKRAGAEVTVVENGEAAVEKAMDSTISQRTVTYDFARLMEDATKVKCSEFASAMIGNM